MTRKLSFSKSGEVRVAKQTTVIGNYNEIVHYRTIEVNNINPSELTMKTRKIAGLGEVFTDQIPLVDFRTLFIKEDNKYILDVYGLSRFLDLEFSSNVQVSFDAIDENASFNVEVFYMLENSADFELHSRLLDEVVAEIQ
ncbi:MAG TPA: hypothetical protein VKG26_15970 [Bacteroidia bacterium]|nr:hypothetical protein [Bacteroidia bacterium]